MVEWNLPPCVFESVGTPGFYLTSLRPAVFATGLWTDPATRRSASNYDEHGRAVRPVLHVLHWYDMTLSVGYAVGFQDSRRTGDEFMISLKIM